MKKSVPALLLAGGLAATFALAGCSDSGGGTANGGENLDLTIGAFSGWDEGIATSWLWKTILEGEGYTVEIKEGVVAPVYEGLAAGDYDFTTDIWLPETHKDYAEKYGDRIVDLGAWNSESKLTLAVNADAPIDSIEELAAKAAEFDNTIVGIEPGAGLTRTMEERVIPDYGLEGFQFITSSTPAMLAELKAATDSGENVVVTLWEPHRAYSQFPIKNLEDPKGALGETENIHSFGSQDFVKNSPQAAKWLENFKMDSEMLYSLEDAMFIAYTGSDYGPVVEQWISDNQEYVDGLTP